jgi:hypothetical protein
MRKSAAALAIAAFLIGSTVSAVNAASPKAGDSCSTGGMSQISDGKRYLCQHQGHYRDFHWDDGTSLKFAAKIPITLPVQADTAPNGITFSNVMRHIADIPAASWQKIHNVIAKNPPVNVPHILYVGPNTTSVTKTLEESLLGEGFRLWEGFQQTTYLNVLLYNSKDTTWAQKKLEDVYKLKHYQAPQDPQMALHLVQQTCSASSRPGQTVGPMGDCNGANAGAIEQSTDSMEMLGVTIADPQHPWNPQQGGVVNHEYTHTVQAAQFIGTASKARSYYGHMQNPCWLNEGQPNATGIGTSSPTLAQYLDNRANIYKGPLDPHFPGFSAAGIKQYLFTQITDDTNPKSCYQDGPLYKMGFSVGMAATEALVAIDGPQATMALIAREADGDTFAQAFQKVYGISWDQGSTILGQVLAAEYAKQPFQAH